MRKYTGTIAFIRFMGALKIILALLMMLGGVTTALSTVAPYDGALGTIFAHRATLVLFGLSFFVSGATLLYGKIRKKKIFIGRSLIAIYLLSFFTFLLELLAFSSISQPLDNLILSVVAAVLWLWWKFKTEYLNMDEIREWRRSVTQEDHKRQ